jgi:sulfite reductase (NADPH) hemoprotein beta-component
MIAHAIREFVPVAADPHLSSRPSLRVYNRYGRRDNIYKARIKILVKDRTPDEVRRRRSSAEWARSCDGRAGDADARSEVERRRRRASRAVPAVVRGRPPSRARRIAADAGLRALVSTATCIAAQVAGLCAPSRCRSSGAACRRATPPPTQMDAIADLADRVQPRRAAGDARAEPGAAPTCAQRDLLALWQRACAARARRRPTSACSTDIIACPGGDFCSLANAVSIPIAQAHRRSASTISTTCTTSASIDLQHLGLHQRLRPPPHRPHRHPRRRQGRRRTGTR